MNSSVSSRSEMSVELEKLLAASLGDAASARAYSAELMVDELLNSAWFPEEPPRRQGSLKAMAQKTSALGSLETALGDAVERLVAQRRVVSARISELERDSRAASGSFQSGLAKPDELLNNICVQMEDLEERFSKVSSSAVLIGDKLVALDGERARVLETDELMEALLALNDPSSKLSKSSNRLVNTLHDPAQLHEASRIVKKMRAFSSELSSPSIAYAVAEIERLSQTTENSLLEEFSSEQQKGNVQGMRKCAESLIEYNDKEKVADRYVWNVMSDRLARGAEPSISSLDPVEDLDALFTKVLTICQEQFPVLDGVFPAVACDSIRELLIERLFNDPAFGILSSLDQLLTTRRNTEVLASDGGSNIPATNGSTLLQGSREYVRLLCAAYEKTCVMVSEIEAIERPNQSTPSKSEVHSNQDRNEDDTDNPTDEPAVISPDRERIHTFLNLQMHSLFGSHRERYMETELDLLQHQFKQIYSAVTFPKPPVISKSKTSAKSKAAATPSVASPSTPSPSGSSTQLVSSASTASISSSNLEKDGVLLPLESSLIFYENLRAVAEDEVVPGKYSEAMVEAIERCEVVLKGSELRGELVTKVYSSFAASFGDLFLGKMVDLTKELLHEQRLTSDSALQYFYVIEALLKRIDFLDEVFDSLIAPAQAHSPTQLTICEESKRKCTDKLESAISAGLQLALTVTEKTVGQILAANQGKNDFVGGQGNMSLSCSKACLKCTEYLQPLVDVICRVLMDENCNRYIVALVKSFKELYLQHLRKFRFDPDGACMLLRDMSEYRQVFRSPTLPTAVDDIFDLLHEIANVFALPPENLGGFVREGKLATLNKQTLLSIIKRRWDYKANAEKIAASLKESLKEAKDSEQ